MLSKEYHDDRKEDAIAEINIRMLHGESYDQAKLNGPYLDMDSDHRKEVDDYFNQ